MFKFPDKFDAQKTDDQLYPWMLGKALVVLGWLTMYIVVFQLSHQYWNKEYFGKVMTETVQNFKDNYVH